jgi:hypothetical protein
LLGNYLLNVCEGGYTDNIKELDRLLTAVNLGTHDATASTVFSQLANLLRRFAQPESAEVSFSVTDAGMPVVTPKIECADLCPKADGEQLVVNSDEAMALLNQAISELGVQIWLVLDRLDEAVVGFPEIEAPVLRALFRTYLDAQAYDHLKLTEQAIEIRSDMTDQNVNCSAIASCNS